MSADNGVYILKTQSQDGGFEYRVAQAMAIDNLTYDMPPGEIDPECAQGIFGESEVFTDRDKAWLSARDVEDEIAQSGWFTEYGVCELDFGGVSFPTKEGRDNGNS